MFLRIRDAAISYERYGSGAPLLCLHGGMGIDSASLCVPGITGLSQYDIEVVLYDQRGHGRTRAPEDESTYTRETWARDAADFARELGWARFALLGHSYGGFIALEYAVRWPETLTHLILIATSAGPVSTRAVRFDTDAELRDQYRQQWAGMFAGKDKHWALFESLRFSARPFNNSYNRELPAYDLRESVRNIHVPALLIVGSQDHYLPHMQRLAALMSGASLHVIQDAGHFPFVEAKQEFVETVVKFLKGD